MAISSKWFTILLLAFLASLVLTACKPEIPPSRALQTGALVSPRATATLSTSPLPTPVVTSGPTLTPFPTPWPRDFTPSPMPTPTPTPAGVAYIITDTVNHFSMTVFPGWYAYTPDATAIGGATSITTYDINDAPPPDGLSIQISSGLLKPGQSFEQWLSEWRVLETSPESGASGVTLTGLQPYNLGRYEGVTFFKHGRSGEFVLEIDLLSSDGRVVVIGIWPADSPTLSEALSMLSTIEISQ